MALEKKKQQYIVYNVVPREENFMSHSSHTLYGNVDR